ncbi:fimbria/pilus periplasmic chaperone [Fusobacterium varium]|uniref:fimbria/pilus periplasmic chaperone n=1 Tax=Fusobacterium varium TaxID=856 RepID=UPI0027DD125C|nr:fimbria/pilus periplasmic chaperone [uncultured Fusobacterium sp.]
MKKLISITLFIILSSVVYCLNFSIAPTGFKIDLNKTITNEITIINNTNQPLRLESFSESDKDFGEKYNLNSNITVFPKIISLKPASSQIVRFKVKPSPNMQDGEYKSYLTFKEIQGKIKTTDSTKINGETNIAIQTEISISIYGDKGTPNVKGNLSNLKLNYTGNAITISASSFSEGNTSLKFLYSLNIAGSDINSTGLFGVSARNGERDINLTMEAPEKLKGKKAKLIITDQNGKVYYDKVHTL